MRGPVIEPVMGYVGDQLMAVCPECNDATEVNFWMIAHDHEQLEQRCGCGAELVIYPGRIGHAIDLRKRSDAETDS